MAHTQNKKVTIVGTMSGTSLDGLDICIVTFLPDSHTILHTETISYSNTLKESLQNAHTLCGLELSQLHIDYGVFCGKSIHSVLQKTNIHADYIVSHGHTVFHTPHTGLTLQIGSGAHIARQAGISTIYNLRELDVAFGGQGAPLVPMGDEFLFASYDYCLNIGGFANMSTKRNGTRIAWDICLANIGINSLTQTYYNKDFDESGAIGRSGKVHEPLLHDLQALPYYTQSPPKSLGREWVESEVFPLLHSYTISAADRIRTLYEHCAMQIGSTLSQENTQTLCTGGGVHNTFLMERIAAHTKSKLIVPDTQIINFKEALIFAYLGYLRIQHKPNCLASVTGAEKDVCGGDIVFV